jgi:hypothetical protein
MNRVTSPCGKKNKKNFGKRKKTQESIKIVWGCDVRWCVPTVAVRKEKYFYLSKSQISKKKKKSQMWPHIFQINT